MTMVPARNLSKQNHRRLLHNNNNNRLVYGGCGGEEYSSEFCGVMSRVEEEGYELYCSTESILGSDLLLVGPIMAEDESRTNSINEAGSSSNKEAQEEHEREEGNWLQLSIGSHTGISHENKNNNLHHHQPVNETVTTATTPRRSSGLIELDLLPGGSSRQARSSSSSMAPMFHVPEIPTPQQRQVSSFGNFSTSLYFQHPGSSSSSNMINFPHHQQHQAQAHHEALNWTFRPFPAHNILGLASTSNSSSSSSSTLMPLGSSSSSYFARQFQIQSGMDVAGPSLDFRVVNPPRRPHSGIWFMLQASQNQAKEPFLPQISKNYLRIKYFILAIPFIQINVCGRKDDSSIANEVSGQ
ncbi:hypothetical protein FNV43_RR25658 [Rhamnella rubrinervis]|uniref:Uncharacterized protein n=1 Tax=Rhamnella rubrinervis TaxID=2594499 RepID=A0A8K0DL75_9ROSA|nr:hypothetical protein FNV43_RR25658 [Rhamnella rubrinervis]